MAAFDQKHYVPILKAKSAEFQALKETRSATKDLMTPVLEIIDVPWDYENEVEDKTIDDHLNGIGAKIANCWEPERRLFVDSNLIDEDRKMLDGATHHFISIFNDLRANNLQSVPVVALDRHPDYKNAVQSIVSTDGRGICLRLQPNDLAGPSLQGTIDTDLALYGVTPQDTDLILDFGAIENTAQPLLELSVPGLINNTIPYINDWRSFTFSATAFPATLSKIKGSSIDTLDRTEWVVWLNLLTKSLSRFPSFGDYSIAHTDMVDIAWWQMTIGASIRYTADEYWLIVKGRSTKKGGYEQFRDLCAQLIARPEYAGAAFSWGDQYISDCAAGTVGTGNTTTWRKVGNNHHFQNVVTQLSS